MPLSAEANAATSNPSADRSGIFSRCRNHMESSPTSVEIVPSGPTLAPERSEQNEVRRAPGKMRESAFGPDPFMDSTRPPSIAFGARRYFCASPTSSEKESTPSGMSQRWLVTKDQWLSQMPLL